MSSCSKHLMTDGCCEGGLSSVQVHSWAQEQCWSRQAEGLIKEITEDLCSLISTSQSPYLVCLVKIRVKNESLTGGLVAEDHSAVTEGVGCHLDVK